MLSQRLSFRRDRNHLCQVTQHFAKLLVKSGGNYLLPPQGEGWCCLCTGIPGRLGKQDMKIHSFLQYHPHCLPTKNENVHTWRKKSMSGPKFWARADDCREHVLWGSKGEKLTEKEKEQHHTWLSPSFIPSCLCPHPSLPVLASFQTTINSTRLQVLPFCAGPAPVATPGGNCLLPGIVPMPHPSSSIYGNHVSLFL